MNILLLFAFIYFFEIASLSIALDSLEIRDLATFVDILSAGIKGVCYCTQQINNFLKKIFLNRFLKVHNLDVLMQKQNQMLALRRNVAVD